MIETQIEGLQTRFRETEQRLAPVEQRIAQGLAGIGEIDPAEFLKIPPLASELEKLLSTRADYSIKGLLAPVTRTLKVFWNGDIPFFKLAMVAFGFCVFVSSIAAVGHLLENAPAVTIGTIFGVVVLWKAVIRWLKRVNNAKWRRLANAQIVPRTFLTVVRQIDDWYVVRKERGERAILDTCRFSVPGIRQGMVILDVYAGANPQFAGAICSDGHLFLPGQFEYPIAISIPEVMQSYFADLAALHELAKEQWHIRIELQNIEERREELAALNDVWKDVHIPEMVKGRLLQMLGLFSSADPAAPRGLLLFGPPGTGKTLIAKAIADSCGVAFHATSLPDFKKGYTGQSAQKVKQFWNEVREKGRGIIFIDECEGVFGTRGGSDSDAFTAEIVQTFLAEWDGLNTKGKAPDIWVIGATNRRELIDSAILSRFGQEIEIPLPDGAMRQQIIEAELMSINLPIDWLPEDVGKLTQGLSGRDLNRLATAIRMAMMGADAPSREYLNVALTQMRKRGATAADEEARWDTLVLDERTMKELKTVCGMLNHADTLRQQGITIPRGIIFHGPPGTGKTQIARTLANESGLNFIAATTSDMKANFLGQSGNKVKELFARARSQSPAILFIDEIDIVCPTRSGAPDPLSQEIIGQILQELDGVKAIAEHVFVVAATNRLDAIDSAVLSRFPKRVEVPLPDLTGRNQLLSVVLRKLNHTLSEEQITRMAENSEGKSGRDIRSIVENAQNNAVSRALESGEPHRVQVTAEDFL